MPDKVTIENEKDKRGGRLLLDHKQFMAKTLVAPYSLRAADGATVSTPIAWDEVGPKLDPRAVHAAHAARAARRQAATSRHRCSPARAQARADARSRSCAASSIFGGRAVERAPRRRLPVGTPDRRDHVDRQLDAVQLARSQPREARRSCRGSRRARSSWSTPARSTTSRRSCSSPARCPRPLHWFKWQNFTTWATGISLLVVVYYFHGAAFLVDPSVHDVGADDRDHAVDLLAVHRLDHLRRRCGAPLGETNPRLATVAVGRDAVRRDLRRSRRCSAGAPRTSRPAS